MQVASKSTSPSFGCFGCKYARILAEKKEYTGEFADAFIGIYQEEHANHTDGAYAALSAIGSLEKRSMVSQNPAQEPWKRLAVFLENRYIKFTKLLHRSHAVEADNFARTTLTAAGNTADKSTITENTARLLDSREPNGIF